MTGKARLEGSLHCNTIFCNVTLGLQGTRGVLQYTGSYCRLQEAKLCRNTKLYCDIKARRAGGRAGRTAGVQAARRAGAGWHGVGGARAGRAGSRRALCAGARGPRQAAAARGVRVRQGAGRAGGRTGSRQGAQPRGRGAQGGRLGAPVRTWVCQLGQLGARAPGLVFNPVFSTRYFS